MIASLFRQKLLLCVVGIGVLIAGFWAYRDLPVDAFPDVSPALVQVFTETDGLAPEEVERYVTYPVEVAMAGLPGLKEVRSISNFGLSVVNVYFEDSTDIYFARQLVGERLQIARDEIPTGFGDPEMGPITTGLGQILFYFVVDESTGSSSSTFRQSPGLPKFCRSVAKSNSFTSMCGRKPCFDTISVSLISCPPCGSITETSALNTSSKIPNSSWYARLDWQTIFPISKTLS